MARFHLRVELDVADTHETVLREEHQLAPQAPILEAVRDDAWQALAAFGAETGRWGGVQVT